MDGWTDRIFRALMLPAVLVALAAPALAEIAPAGASAGAPHAICLTRMAVLEGQQALSGEIRLAQFQQLAACRPRCRTAANPERCYARRAACVRSCGC